LQPVKSVLHPVSTQSVAAHLQVPSGLHPFVQVASRQVQVPLPVAQVPPSLQSVAAVQVQAPVVSHPNLQTVFVQQAFLSSAQLLVGQSVLSTQVQVAILVFSHPFVHAASQQPVLSGLHLAPVQSVESEQVHPTLSHPFVHVKSQQPVLSGLHFVPVQSFASSQVQVAVLALSHPFLQAASQQSVLSGLHELPGQ